MLNLPNMAQFRDEALLKKIAKKLKQLREEHNVTQETFYNDTNIHIGRIESLKSNISVSTLNVICKYFGITLAEFFEGLKE